jgi:hypothetical protein
MKRLQSVAVGSLGTPARPGYQRWRENAAPDAAGERAA